MNCPNCSLEVGPNARFCGSCGATIDPNAAAQGVIASVPQPAQVQPQQASAIPTPQQQGSVQQAPPPNTQQAPPPQYAAGETFHLDADGRGQGSGYTWQIDYQGAFALATVQLQPEQSISAESGAMVSMSANVHLHAEMKGGIVGALKRAAGGESAFVSTFTAQGAPGEVTLAPGSPGDIVGIEMQNQDFMVQASSYLAGDTNLAIETKFGGRKSYFGSEGLFVLRVTGTGLLLVSSFGTIHRKTLRPSERYIIDTGHLVAWEGHMQYNLKKASSSGYFRSLMSGEGLVSEFIGPGEILIQTRNLAAFAGLLKPFFPSQS
jgi:uncharacterized protein (TIGR00266 family)